MITQETVAQKILDYLNGKIDLLMLVHWSEDTLFVLTESDHEVANERAIMDILGYIGAGDTAPFPLTWEVLTKILNLLGIRVRVVSEGM